MATADRTSENQNLGATQARTRDGNLAALSAVQQATSGKGPGLDVRSENTEAPAVAVRGAGTLLELKDSGGTTKFSVGQDGTVSSTGTQTVTGDQVITGDFAVTGYALGEVTPAAHNLTAWSYDPSGAVNAIQITSGTVYLAKLHIARDATVTKLYWWMPVAGATTSAGQNFGGLYSSAGVRLAQADADATVTATAGLQTLTLASTALTAGTFVWAALLFNAGTAPTLAYASGATGATTALNVGLTAATYRYATAGTSQTALPSSITPGSNSPSLIAGPWVAIGP